MPKGWVSGTVQGNDAILMLYSWKYIFGLLAHGMDGPWLRRSAFIAHIIMAPLITISKL